MPIKEVNPLKKPYDCNFSKESAELAKEVVSLLIRSGETYETCKRALEAADILLENLTRPILIKNAAQ